MHFSGSTVPSSSRSAVAVGGVASEVTIAAVARAGAAMVAATVVVELHLFGNPASIAAQTAVFDMMHHHNDP